MRSTWAIQLDCVKDTKEKEEEKRRRKKKGREEERGKEQRGTRNATQ